MLRNKLFFISLIFLTACSTTPPGIKIVTQEVKVPVSVPCKVKTPTKPDFNFDKLKIEDNLETKTRSLLADRLLHLGYETELEAALNSCIK